MSWISTQFMLSMPMADGSAWSGALAGLHRTLKVPRTTVTSSSLRTGMFLTYDESSAQDPHELLGSCPRHARPLSCAACCALRCCMGPHLVLLLELSRQRSCHQLSAHIRGCREVRLRSMSPFLINAHGSAKLVKRLAAPQASATAQALHAILPWRPWRAQPPCAIPCGTSSWSW